MAQKKNRFYATSNGKPLGIGLRGLFGWKRGVLIPVGPGVERTDFESAGAQSKSLNRAIERTIAAQKKLRESVIFDWPKVQALLTVGEIKVERVS